MGDKVTLKLRRDVHSALKRNKPDGVTWDHYLSGLFDESGKELDTRSPAEKLRDAARLTREAGDESPEMPEDWDPPVEMKDVDVPSVRGICEEIAQVQTQLAINVEVLMENEQ